MSSVEPRVATAVAGAVTERRLKVACPRCDVTWRGTTADECWSCGQNVAIAAPAAAVKIVPPAAAAS